MSRGLLDIAAWPVELLDHALATLHVPALARIMLWGVLAGAAGMWLYRRYSPQQLLVELRQQLAEVQRALTTHDGEFSDLWILIKRQLLLALRQLRASVVPALMAGLPALLLLPWLSNEYDLVTPTQNMPVKICISPSVAVTAIHWDPESAAMAVDQCWHVVWPAEPHVVHLREGERELLQIPTQAISPVIHKFQFFNLLIGNPAGYLDPASKIDSISLDLPTAELIPYGPTWSRGWMPAFFLAVLLVSLWLRRRWRLQ
ncbi:MAG: hypothetical protein ABI411_01060 [Tahibacter sp.]